jgi:hypothetical protein
LGFFAYLITVIASIGRALALPPEAARIRKGLDRDALRDSLVETGAMLDLAPVSLLLMLLFGAFVIAFAWPRPAGANTEFVNDPADTSGPLDIKEAVEGHDGPGALTARLKTWEAFHGRSLSGPNIIGFAFYEQGYPFRWVYVHRRGPRLAAVVEKDDGEVLGVEPVSRPNRRTVAVHIPKALVGQPRGYSWAVLTAFRNRSACARTCTDAAPSSGQYEKTGTSIVDPRLHDLTAPVIRLLDFPDPSTRRSASLRYRVRFAVRDEGGAGLKNWRLKRRRLGASRWATVAQGSSAGRHHARLRGHEGATYAHRLIAVDRQGNRRWSRVAWISVPLDDANASLSSSYTGDWKTDAAVPSDFRGTLHTSSDPAASFDYAFNGAYVALIGPASAGTASVAVDEAMPVEIDLAAFNGRRRVLFARDLPAGAHTFSLTVVSGVVGIDGIVVRGDEEAAARGAVTAGRMETEFGATELTGLPADDGLDCKGAGAEDPLCVRRVVGRALSARYNDSWRGWPVRPLHKQHPVRGSFLDPRPGGLHFGVDIGVRDDRPEKRAPPDRTHRVYAVEGGTVYNLFDGAGMPCSQRRLWIGHFAYYHVDATVRSGASVAPGQMIGWTCKGEWHVHLSELTSAHVLVNPLHPGGKLAPYTDSKPPVIKAFSFYKPASNLWSTPHGAMWSPATGQSLSPDDLHGTVDVRVRVSDPQSFRGWLKSLPYLYADLHPDRLALDLVRSADRTTVLHREISGPVFPYSLPHNNHFAPGTRANQRDASCFRFRHRGLQTPVQCAGRYWIHAFGTTTTPYIDTKTLPDGRYRLRITAWDPLGHKASKAVDVRIDNRS